MPRLITKVRAVENSYLIQRATVESRSNFLDAHTRVLSIILDVSRWLVALLVLALACTPIILQHNASPSLLQDSDTHAILGNIRERNDALSWFKGDWPLLNHFYRPVVALSFELDNAVYGNNAAGYGWTNTLFCVGCILALFWFIRELTDSLPFASAGACLLAVWVADAGTLFLIPTYVLASLLLFFGVRQHAGQIGKYLPAVLLILYLGIECRGLSTLGYRVQGWLPGRTATVMTFFALVSVAAYARFERLHAKRPIDEITALTLPATRTSVQPAPSKPPPWIWPFMSLLAASLALASYEQAIMLPLVLSVVCLSFSHRGYKVRRVVPLASGAILVAYVILRHALLPSGLSTYESQQLRHGASAVFDIANYLFPATPSVTRLISDASVGLFAFFSLTPIRCIVAISANVVSCVASWRQRTLAYAGLAMSVIAFLPMAFVKPFDHYQFWPMALRTVFVVTLACVAGEQSVIAASPRFVQAPRRPSPAVGSLPHP